MQAKAQKINICFSKNMLTFCPKRTYVLSETCLRFIENDLMFSLKRLDVLFKTT